MTVPPLSDVIAAWHGLPEHIRDRIGIIAVDMVFSDFVYGDAYVAVGQPEDRAVLDKKIRAAAAETANRRLNELTRVIEAALPYLFGPDGENPAWCDNPGAERAPAAIEAAAVEREEDAARKRERELLDAIYPEQSPQDAMSILMWRSRAREAEASAAELRHESRDASRDGVTARGLPTMPDPQTVDDTDPVVAAIVATDMAALTHAAALVFRDEEDDESEAQVDAAAAARDETFRVVRQAMPVTLSGLLTLVRFYERDARIYDSTGSGSGYLGHVAAVLASMQGGRVAPA